MMRRLPVTLVLLAAAAGPAAGPALALQGSDAMSAWRTASEAERTEVLKGLKGASDGPALRRCLDETAKVPGHADLPIAEVAKACSKDTGQPV